MDTGNTRYVVGKVKPLSYNVLTQTLRTKSLQPFLLPMASNSDGDYARAIHAAPALAGSLQTFCSQLFLVYLVAQWVENIPLVIGRWNNQRFQWYY